MMFSYFFSILKFDNLSGTEGVYLLITYKKIKKIKKTEAQYNTDTSNPVPKIIQCLCNHKMLNKTIQ